MSSEELKPCPLCGGEAKEDWGGTAEFYGHEHQTVTIECASCGVSLSIDTCCGKDGLASRGYEFACSCCNDTGAVARKRWNTRAQLAAIQSGTGEVVEVVAWRVTGAGGLTVTPEQPRWAESDPRLCIEPLMTVSQHQRITAAMAAEVERLKAEVTRWHTLACNHSRAEDQLRAELAEVKGREAVAWYTEDHLEDKSATTYSKEVAERWRAKGWPVWPLYASPPASPDVEGLVKALEADFPLLDDNGLDESLHHCEWNIQQERKRLHTALSTWRQAQEGKV